jgi:hypothetical protein
VHWRAKKKTASKWRKTGAKQELGVKKVPFNETRNIQYRRMQTECYIPPNLAQFQSLIPAVCIYCPTTLHVAIHFPPHRRHAVSITETTPPTPFKPLTPNDL